MEALPRSFYERDSVTVARELIGTFLVSGLETGNATAIGRIVETEAYRQDDPASHSYRGRTPRAAIMYGPPGVAYVYFIYGMYHCLNAVTEPEGFGGAVLIRALEPLKGAETMWQRRFPHREYTGTAAELQAIASGPGKLTVAMGIRRESHNGLSLLGSASDGASVAGTAGALANETASGATAPSITICAPGDARDWRGESRIAATPRIGISKATDKLWRFVDAESGCLSKPLPRSSPRSMVERER